MEVVNTKSGVFRVDLQDVRSVTRLADEIFGRGRHSRPFSFIHINTLNVH